MRTYPERAVEAKNIIHELEANGLSINDIVSYMEGRVSIRTLFRWKNGSVSPKSKYDLYVLSGLLNLVQEKTSELKNKSTSNRSHSADSGTETTASLHQGVPLDVSSEVTSQT